MAKALAEITSRTGTTYVFDRDVVAAIYDFPFVEKIGRPAPVVPHVRGIDGSPVPIQQEAQALLVDLGIADQFISVAGLHGEVKIRASAVSLLLDKVAGVSDARVKCVVFIAGDYLNFLQVVEDVSTVRKKIDAVRAKQGPGA